MKTGKNICRVLLSVMGLILILSPGVVLAQGEKTDLLLNVVRDYSEDLMAGEEVTLYLEVINTGTKPVTNIRFSADGPEGWTFEFRPLSIDYLNHGSVQTVNVDITSAVTATRSSYHVIIIAEANEIRRVTSTYLSVEDTASFWLWVGAAIAALVVVGFIVVYLRFGRQ